MLRWTPVFLLVLVAGCDKRPSQQELQAKIDLLEAENNQLKQSADRADAASAEYDSCLANARAAYNERWNDSCADERKGALKRRESCRGINGEDDQLCSSIEIPPARECTLPSAVADDYDAGLRHSEEMCLGRLKVGR